MTHRDGVDLLPLLVFRQAIEAPTNIFHLLMCLSLRRQNTNRTHPLHLLICIMYLVTINWR